MWSAAAARGAWIRPGLTIAGCLVDFGIRRGNVDEWRCRALLPFSKYPLNGEQRGRRSAAKRQFAGTQDMR